MALCAIKNNIFMNYIVLCTESELINHINCCQMLGWHLLLFLKPEPHVDVSGPQQSALLLIQPAHFLFPFLNVDFFPQTSFTDFSAMHLEVKTEPGSAHDSTAYAPFTLHQITDLSVRLSSIINQFLSSPRLKKASPFQLKLDVGGHPVQCCETSLSKNTF